MRRRHSTGSVVKQRGRWKGYWYENGVRKTRIIGLVKDMTKGEAKATVMKIVAEHRQVESGSLNFGQFIEGPYFDFYSRKWKASTAENNKQRIRTHLVAAYPIGNFVHSNVTSFRTCSIAKVGCRSRSSIICGGT